MFTVIILLIVLAALVYLTSGSEEVGPGQGGRRPRDPDEGWEYGDVWKQGLEEEEPDDADISYVEILRGDTGMGFNDSIMVELVGYLGSRGIRATFDSFSVALELGAMKTYVLKVEMGREEEAGMYLEEKLR